MNYDDGLIEAGDDALLIRRYSALLRSKRIPYSKIRSVEKVRLGVLRRWRLWGTTIPGYWFNLDFGRPRKSVGFLIRYRHLIRPVITPRDPDRLIKALRSHKVKVDA